MTIGICGFGLIGKQRLNAVRAFDPNINIVVLEPFSTGDFPEIENVVFVENAEQFWGNEFEAVIVATPHQHAIEYVETSLQKGIRTLVEKPMGRSLEEAAYLSNLDQNNLLSVGFNYRFMPGVIRLVEEIRKGTIGKLVSLKFVLGHGGSPDDGKSWKLNPEIAGGGALLDPGIHIIDLIVNEFGFIGETKPLAVTDWSGFWKTGIEEQVDILGNVGEATFSITSSVVLWRTTFTIQALGDAGYLEVNGRARSDGPQTFTYGPRWGWLESSSQKDSEKTELMMSKDISLENETAAWLAGEKTVCTSEQALSAMKLYDNLLHLMEKDKR